MKAITDPYRYSYVGEWLILYAIGGRALTVLWCDRGHDKLQEAFTVVDRSLRQSFFLRAMGAAPAGPDAVGALDRIAAIVAATNAPGGIDEQAQSSRSEPSPAQSADLAADCALAQRLQVSTFHLNSG